MTSLESLNKKFEVQKAAFAKDPCPSLKERLARIARLSQMLSENRELFHQSLASDFTSHPSRLVDMMETGPVLSRAAYYAENLEKWMSPRQEQMGPAHGSSRGEILQLPLGVCGNISPWNFPVESALVMCVDMLGAGNRVIVKPSELAPATANLLENLVAKYFDPDLLTIVQGDEQLGAAFSSLQWDHLTFTGSPRVGKLVLQAAAKNMVPVTLELGGKNPAVFAADGVTTELIKLFLSFRTLKSGQVCTSPDHIRVPAEELENWIAIAANTWKKFYKHYVGHKDITGIINNAHYERLMSYIDEAQKAGVRTINLNGDIPDADHRQIPLTLIIDPPPNLACARDEVFGPVIPVHTYQSISAVFDDINSGPAPLASYLATYDETLAQKFLTTVRSGGAAINNFGIQGGHNALPFGGFGNSGRGCHSGREGFLNYTHTKSVFYGANDSHVHKALTPPLPS